MPRAVCLPRPCACLYCGAHVMAHPWRTGAPVITRACLSLTDSSGWISVSSSSAICLITKGWTTGEGIAVRCLYGNSVILAFCSSLQLCCMLINAYCISTCYSGAVSCKSESCYNSHETWRKWTVWI